MPPTLSFHFENEEGDLEIVHLDEDQSLQFFSGQAVTGFVAESPGGVTEDGRIVVHQRLE